MLLLPWEVLKAIKIGTEERCQYVVGAICCAYVSSRCVRSVRTDTLMEAMIDTKRYPFGHVIVLVRDVPQIDDGGR